jgi:hypothetical protein
MKNAVIIALLINSWVPVHAADPIPAEAELMAIKSKLPFISLGDFLYHREPRDYSLDSKVKAAWGILNQLNSAQCTVTDLVALTQHADADIRALALLGLMSKETPEVVSASLRLMNDSSVTLPNQNEPGGRVFGEHEIFTEPQTVAGIARKILGMMGCRLFWSKDATEAEAAAWWAPRKGNQDWLAWHAFLYKRASQGTTPVRPETKEAIQRFRKHVDALSATTRSWVLLYLADDVFMSRGKWEDYFATEKEMIDAVNFLGAHKLIEFLRSGKRLGLREPSLDDREKGSRFIVTYASHFFAKQHAEELLDLKLFTAAMDADPSDARRLAEKGMEEFAGKYREWDRAKVMAALAALGDATDQESAIKWFYEEPNNAGGSTPQNTFIHELEHRRPEQWRDVVHGVVDHPGFGLLSPMDVMYLALMVEKLGGGDKLIPAGYRYEDHADTTRGQLRVLFQIKQNSEISILNPPEKFLQEPEWKTELDALGSSLDVSDDGKLLAIGFAKDGQDVRIISADKGTVVARLPIAGQEVRVVFATRSHELVCAPGSGKTVQIWSDSGGKTASHVMQIHSSVRPSRRLDRAAALGNESLAWLELPGGKALWKQDFRKRLFSAFQISPDASFIACNDGWSKDIDIIKTAEGQHHYSLSGHAAAPSKLGFSRDSELLISTADDSRVIIWSLAEGKSIATYRGQAVRFGPLAFNSDGQSFFASPVHGQLASYSVANGDPQFGIKFFGNWIAFAVTSADDKRLYLMIQHTGSESLSSSVSKSRIECWKLP